MTRLKCDSRSSLGTLFHEARRGKVGQGAPWKHEYPFALGSSGLLMESAYGRHLKNSLSIFHHSSPRTSPNLLRHSLCRVVVPFVEILFTSLVS